MEVSTIYKVRYKSGCTAATQVITSSVTFISSASLQECYCASERLFMSQQSAAQRFTTHQPLRKAQTHCHERKISIMKTEVLLLYYHKLLLL